MNRNKRPRREQDGGASDGPSAAAKPQLTRACAECKKHKVKCFVQPGNESCEKCLKSSITCVPHNLAQKFMDEDASWKSDASMTFEQLKKAVAHLLQHNNLPDLSTYDSQSSFLQEVSETVVTPASLPVTTHYTSGTTGNYVPEGPATQPQEDESDLVPLPMNNLYSLTNPDNSRLIQVDPSLVNGPDFISRGIIPLAEANSLFDYFRLHINPLLWDGILCVHKTLSEARESSSLLVATVLTVAALHIPNNEKSLQVTHEAFVSLMRASCMLRSQNLDDIRGLCIGAFYLTSLSWALCSRAIRVATEMNLHKSSLQFARGSLESYERVRLWYILYVCDHQFALAYGRPPMMHDDAAIRNADKLLTSGLSSEGDRVLVAQVKLFRILASCYFMYGCDADLELSGQDFEMLQSLNISLDQWRLAHQPRGSESTKNTLASPKAITLYYHLARFQLNSLSLRGISARRTSNGLDMNWDRQEAANNAISAAMSTVRLIVEDNDVRDAQIGMPIFVHAMIAVCASFLLKMAVVFAEPNNTGASTLYLPKDLARYGLTFHTKHVLSEVERLVRALNDVADNASQQHVARHVITGLGELLQRFSPGADMDSYVYSRSGGVSMTLDTNAAQQDLHIRHEANSLDQVNNSHYNQSDQDVFAGQAGQVIRQDSHEDPFDLMGDLDWRFNDAFLQNIYTEEGFM